MSSSDLVLPERMYRQNRDPDPVFLPDEKLFRRFEETNVEGNRLLPSAISFRGWSVNRGNYSEPEDVLLPAWTNQGIAFFCVQDVPPCLCAAGSSVQYDFQVEHDPLEENYAHSEVRTYKDKVYVKDPDPPKTVKKQFRQILSDRIIILKKPKTE